MVAWRERYEYVRELGEGAGGRVVLVRDRAEGLAERALKMCRPDQAERLLVEHEELCAIDSPALVRVRELLLVAEPVSAPFSFPRGALVLVEDLAEGESPGAQVLAWSAREDRSAFLWNVADGALTGLAALHARGLVHGDVKPENLHCAADGRRVVLLDLGLCRPENEHDVVRGTPALLAPEAFFGVCTAALDVYALGATLFDLALLAPGFASVHDPAAGNRDLRQLTERVSPELAGFIARLLAADVAERPADAFAARAALCMARALPLPERRLGAERVSRVRGHVGHAHERAALVRALREESLVVVQGEPLSGRSSLVRAAVAELQREAARAGAESPTFVRGLVRAAPTVGEGSTIVWLEHADADTLARARRARELASVTGQRRVLVLEAPTTLALGDEVCVTVRPLARDELVQLFVAVCGRPPHEPELRASEDAAGALSGRVCALLGLAQARGQAFVDVARATPLERPPLSAQAAHVQAVLAWCGHDAALAPTLAQLVGPGVLHAALAELRALGAFAPGSALELRTALASAVRTESLTDGALVARVGALDGRVPLSAWAHVLLGRRAEAERTLLAEGARLRAAGDSFRAAELLGEAASRLTTPALALAAADAERACGRHRVALSLLEGEVGVEAQRMRVELWRLTGDAARALDSVPPGDVEALPLAARAHFDRGELTRAAALLAALPSAAPLVARVRAAELHALLARARGEDARGASDEHVRLARELGDARLLARALGLSAQASEGRSAQRRAMLIEAVELARGAGELHEAATFALNLALWDLDDGELAAAQSAFGEAADELRGIDRPADRLRVLVNFALLSLALGDVQRAAQALRDARRLCARVADRDARIAITLGEAECDQREGRTLDALQRVTEAQRELAPEQVALAASCAARKAQLHALRGAHEAALAELTLHEALPLPESARMELASAQLRCALASAERARTERAAGALRALLGGSVSFDLRVRALLGLREAAAFLGDDDARRVYSEEARALLERALRGLSPGQRARMRAVPEYTRVLAEPSAGERHATDDPRGLAALLQATRHWHTLEEPRRLASALADGALAFIHAERALVIAEAEPERWAVVGHAGARDGASASHFSRTLIERVFNDGGVLVSVDAQADVRLDAARSLHTVPMRSVLVAPVQLPSGRAVLYLDDRLRSGAFAAQDVALASALLELFRRALWSAHALDRERKRLRRARRDADALSDALTRARHAEPRPAVHGIVGASSALERALALARRVARSELSVLLQGESGTGKELFARFVHAESPRAARAFVAESCAALPDALLESALFGHVRGAFTGAERARRGLFELADGGTLFLDEVGEMSPAMQAKLLRVLQSGEFWPLGSERPKRCDVRVIAATRRDLGRAKASGEFREDLYYRLAVVTIGLPALRERREDIPELAAHVLRELGSPLVFTPEALAALQQADLPGNVRELENVVRRAALLAGAGPIAPQHLGLDQGDRGQAGALDTTLHEAVDALTERLARAALMRADNNVTRAAQALGVSRFGLQKIMKRFGLRESD